MERPRSQWLRLLVVGGLAGILLGGILGYGLASYLLGQELERVTHVRDRYAVRERELQAQLQEALTAHATLARDHAHLQRDLAERIRRLEATAPVHPPPPLDSSLP